MNKLRVDNIDVYERFGVMLQIGSYAGIAQWPELKNVASTDWPDEDGIDVDLTDVKLNSREFEMSFGCIKQDGMYDFVDLLSDGAYHKFNIEDLGLIKTLRLTSQPKFDSSSNLSVFSLQFADDFPLEEYKYEEPVSMEVKQSGYEIDDRSLSYYGVWVLAGTDKELRKIPTVKKNLTIEENAINGFIYDDAVVLYNSKDVSLKCLLVAPDSASFWRNYNALLFDLSKDGERTFYFAKDNEIYGCYYKSQKVNRMSKAGKGLLCDFDITLCFVSARPGLELKLLATEDSRFVITEDSTDNYKVYINVG